MRFLTGILILAMMFCGCLSGCSKEGGEEEKQKVLEKKEPKDVQQKTHVAVTADVKKIPGDLAELEKALLMTQEDVSAHLKSYNAKLTMTYITKRKENEVKLAEVNELRRAENGDFYLKTGNDFSKGGLELYRIGGQTFDRFATANFTKAVSEGKELYWMEKNFGAMDRFYKYFRGHLKFGAPETTTYAARPAVQLSFELDPAGKTPENDLPTVYNYPNQYALSAIATDKLINQNRKRISRFEEASGTITLDAQTGARLAFALHGKYAVPIGSKRKEEMEKQTGEADAGKEVVFTMDAVYETSEIGGPVTIRTPEFTEPPKRSKPPEDPKSLLPGNDPGPPQEKTPAEAAEEKGEPSP